MTLTEKVKKEIKMQGIIRNQDNFKRKVEYYERLKKKGIIKKEEYNIAPIDTIGKTFNNF